MTLPKIFQLPLNWLKKFGHAFGKFQTTLILSLLYYFLLAPIGLVFQLVTSLKQVFSLQPKTYWLARDHQEDLKNIYNQF
ncbi:SxtJ family membrane protein [Patescibacteria group bacterium]